MSCANRPGPQSSAGIFGSAFLIGLLVGLLPCSAQNISDHVGAAPFDDYVAACQLSAELNALAVLDQDHLIVVGDRGLVLRSDSGGRRWTQVSVKTTANLHGVRFTDDQNGVAVGGWIGSYSGSSRAVVLRTTDAGQSWHSVSVPGVPRLIGVKQNARRLLAWGDYSPGSTSPLFESIDGGLSWRSLSVPLSHCAAATIASGPTVAAVDRLGRAMIGQRDMVTITTPQQPINAIGHTGLHWLACGYGGALIFSQNGKDWSNVQLPLSDAARSCCDWNVLSRVDDQIWIGGSPGSVLLHSPDRGKTWDLQPTGLTAGIRDIQFVDADRGWALGDRGTIWATRDGGKGWYAQRQPAMRTGMLALAADSEAIAWTPLVSSAWDQQQSVELVVASRAAPIVNADFLAPIDSLYQSLAPQLGLGATAYWSLPNVTTGPGEEVSSVEQVNFQRRLAVKLMSSRPDLVFVSPSKDSKANRASRLESLALTAIESAASPKISDVAGELALGPWQTQKLVVVDQRAGQYSEQPLRLLSGPALSIQDLLHPLPPVDQIGTTTIPMKTVWSKARNSATDSTLWGGISPTAETRWPFAIDEIGNYQLVMGRTHREKTLDRLAAPEGQLAQDAAWQAGLKLVVKGMPIQETSLACYKLAQALAANGEWSRRNLVLIELCLIQPESDAADWARIELLRSVASDEMRAWRKSIAGRQTTSEHLVSAAAATENASSAGRPIRINQVNSIWGGSPFASGSTDAQLGSADQVVTASVTSELADSAVMTDENRWSDWFSLLDQFRKASPDFRDRLDVTMLTQRALARYAKERGQTPELIDAKGLDVNHLVGWPQAYRQERLLQQNQLESLRWVAGALPAQSRPVLDAVLDDDCWRAAPEMELRSLDATPHTAAPQASPERKKTGATQIRWAYDDQYLYISAVCERFTPKPDFQLSGTRSYDADLSSLDHIEVTLDTDRDYCTAIDLAIAENGQTYDRCLGLANYNPKWHISVQPESHHWTAEIAIELSELTTETDLAGQAWAISARRKLGQLSVQSWSQLRTHRRQLSSGGLLLFVPASIN